MKMGFLENGGKTMNNSIQNVKAEVNSIVSLSIPHTLPLGDKTVAQPLHGW